VSGPPTGGRRQRRTLIAGIGNVFLGDDGFGVEVLRRLAGRPLPPGTDIADIGVLGVQLANQLLDGYDTAVLVDATRRGGEPGTLYLIDAARAEPVEPGHALLDGHRMTPDAVLALLDTLSAGTGGQRPRAVWVLGCEPAELHEHVGLSAPVAAAVDEAVRLVLETVSTEGAGAPRPAPPVT
jgi:hydrogenase maturation protease